MSRGLEALARLLLLAGAIACGGSDSESLAINGIALGYERSYDLCDATEMVIGSGDQRIGAVSCYGAAPRQPPEFA